MRIFGPTATLLEPAAGSLVASAEAIGTATADSVTGPTTIYTVPSDGLYRINLAGQTYNSNAVSGALAVVVDMTGAGGIPLPESQSLGLTGDANAEVVTCRNLQAGSTIDLTLTVGSFSGTSCDYAVRLAVERLN